MAFTLNPGAIFLALIIIVFLFCLLRGLKTEGCLGKVFALFIVGVILITIITCKGG